MSLSDCIATVNKAITALDLKQHEASVDALVKILDPSLVRRYLESKIDMKADLKTYVNKIFVSSDSNDLFVCQAHDIYDAILQFDSHHQKVSKLGFRSSLLGMNYAIDRIDGRLAVGMTKTLTFEFLIELQFNHITDSDNEWGVRKATVITK
jgi:hypothetical protein